MMVRYSASVHKFRGTALTSSVPGDDNSASALPAVMLPNTEDYGDPQKDRNVKSCWNSDYYDFSILLKLTTLW